jgi:ribonucleoside-diphosphate reductase alpha chain
MSGPTKTSRYLSKMEVIKRDGRREKVSFDKIIQRIEKVCEELNLKRINPIEIAKDTVQGIYDGITTEELDFFASNKCAEKIMDDPEYNKLAAGLCISNLHKTTSDNFMEVTDKLYNNLDNVGVPNPLVTKEYYDAVKNNIEKIQSALQYNRDYAFDFFGVKTMERAYLIRLKTHNIITDNKTKTVGNGVPEEEKMRMKFGRIIERPQHLFMRVAIGIHGEDIDRAIETYDLVSMRYFTHASPTLYNAGSPNPQMSSCFLLGMADSIEGIFRETISDVSLISKWAGGIGIHIQDIRAKGSLIRGTNGTSDGVIPMIKVLNATARYVNQGGRRNGAIAVYIEPWHADIYDFCDLRKNTGTEELRARDIFLALWVNDIFMERVKADEMWSLMCPDECPKLTTTYGDEFNQLYTMYEREGRFKKQVKATDLWFHILSAQIETGMPYMTFKDNINGKSNQINVGVIQSSNLCAEICEYSDPDETAVCNLASICLPTFIETDKNGHKSYNYEKLCEVSKVATRNLNKVIDLNYYPIEKARKSNMKHRPIGLGVQGLADVYAILDMPFDSEEARIVNKKIFETIYYGALCASCELAKVDGYYTTFPGSPFSEGKLQWHMWGLTEKDLLMNWDWNSLIKDIIKYGTRNSLLTALMPTASTSQLMCNNEAFEPYTTNMYTRTTLAGEYMIINQHLVEKLIDQGLWTKEIREEFMFDNGSIQKIDEIPHYIKEVFKTAFEMKAKPIVQQSIERGPFVDQSQSMNLFMGEPDFDMLTSSHFYSWKNGLKTGMYYLRTRPAVNAIKFGLDPDIIKRIETKRKIVHKGYDDDDDDDDDNAKSVLKTTVAKKVNNRRDDDLKECEMCSG